MDTDKYFKDNYDLKWWAKLYFTFNPFAGLLLFIKLHIEYLDTLNKFEEELLENLDGEK